VNVSWAGWSIEPPLAYVALAGLLFALGGRRSRRPPEPLRTASFAAGLATIVLALDSPLDGYADQLFWAHMLQHVLLLTVAPPLILLGRPWPRMWLALPLDVRTSVGRTVASSRFAAPLRALARPWPAWVLFNCTIIAWHLPGAYNATLTSPAVHQLEHAMFFFTGLLFWARVIDPGPLRPRLVWPLRIAYAVGAMVVGWGLAIALVLAPHPLYAHYAGLAHRPGGISALTDQQLAAGVMWVPGSITYTIAFLLGFYRWLEPERAALAT
jgi:putative membrane protein